MAKKRKIAFHTFGCKLNYSETSGIARKFAETNYEVVDFKDHADVFVINTCSVTENAEKKCRQTIRNISRRNENAVIAVVGCYAQLREEDLRSIPGVKIVLGSNEKFNLDKHLEEHFNENGDAILHEKINDELHSFHSSFSMGDRTRSFLKVQDGCDYFCSYCTIPYARGRSRNKPIVDLVNDARHIASQGIQEIILTGVNIGDFGKSTGETFFDLLKELDKLEELKRLRLSSIEPDLMTDEIIHLVSKSDKILPHIHLPLQSGNDYILKQMKRKYERSLFADRVSIIKKEIPNASIGTDVIVGFPDETDERFTDTYTFLKNTDVSYIHVFSYSARPGTLSYRKDVSLDQHIINERSRLLHDLNIEKQEHFISSQIGQLRTVLFETDSKAKHSTGLTDNYIRIRTGFDPSLKNHIRTVKLLKINKDYSVSGQIIE